jgi:uncharacterized protein
MLMPTHGFFRGLGAALLCASVALSCATSPPATRKPAPIVDAQGTKAREQPPAPLIVPSVTGEAPPSKPHPFTLKEAHIALLLPTEAPDFRPAAEAFQSGFQAAQKVHGHPIAVRLYPTDASADGIARKYTEAVENNARVVVGPMTRSGVTALASSALVVVPTLSLNQPESAARVPDLYLFGLSVEQEAAMVAQWAFNENFRNAAVVTAANPLARRMRDAFVQAWRAAGGSIAGTAEPQPGADLITLRDLSATGADSIFLAAGFEDARLLRPYLPSQLPVYTTSQINLRAGDPRRDLDLAGVRFLDMPWILQPDDPRVAAYPPALNLSGETLRFYALGIDAYRIATALADGQHAMEFEGVTGSIRVYADGLIDRYPWPALFRDGLPVRAQ